MRLYNPVGPNPRVVRTEVDLRGGENRRAAHLARNPAGQMPCLELDDGFYRAEITAIVAHHARMTARPSAAA